MQIKPIILAKTQYDFDTLYRSAKQALGYNINRTNDSRQIKKEGPKLYHALSEFIDEDYVPASAMDGLVLDHYEYTIGLIVDQHLYNSMLHYREIRIIGQETTKRGVMFLIATGTLRQWRSVIIDGCSKSADAEVRDVMNAVYNTFVSEGFMNLWSGFSKNSFEGTMILVEQ
jgi:hypothetical protein